MSSQCSVRETIALIIPSGALANRRARSYFVPGTEANLRHEHRAVTPLRAGPRIPGSKARLTVCGAAGSAAGPQYDSDPPFLPHLTNGRMCWSGASCSHNSHRQISPFPEKGSFGTKRPLVQIPWPGQDKGLLYAEGAPNCVQEYSAVSVLRRVASEPYKPKTVRRVRRRQAMAGYAP